MAPNTRSGVYSTTHESGDRYVGSAVNLEKRWRLHLRQLRAGSHHSRHLQHAWNKYGEDSFRFKALLYCDRRNLILFEQRAIDVLKPEYNISPTAGSTIGVVHTEEACRHMGESRRGKKRIPFSEGHLIHLRESHLGKKATAETLLRMSASQSGKVLTEDHRRKIGDAQRGRQFSEDTRQRMSEAQRGKKRKPHTEETRRKLSVAATADWARRRAAKQGSQ